MIDNSIDINQKRMISNFFTSTFFKNNLKNDQGMISVFQKIEKYYKYDQRKKLKNIFSDLYSDLLKNYKCEYIFKNELFNKLLEKYHFDNVAYFDEFKINNSIADLICFNGIITVYEIKTDLDSLEKLNKQINDYKTIADKIYVVTTSSFCKKIESNIKYNGVGIIILNEDNELIKHRESDYELSLDRKSLYKLLHKKEVNDLMLLNFGFIPDTPNTLFLRYCYNLLEDVEILKFQRQVINKIKKRKIKSTLTKEYLDNMPYELKYIFNNLDLNNDELDNIKTNLNYKKICTHHMLEVNNLNY